MQLGPSSRVVQASIACRHLSMPPERSQQPDLLWYKDAIIYELHVRAFHDSNADGIGDFRGLTQKLDYLQELGVTAIWLLPFYPSPLRDDGYDISDYVSIHSNYGTLDDFRAFLTEAHTRGLKRDYRTGAESHFGPACLVSGVAELAGQSQAQLVCLERYRRPLPAGENYLSR